MTYLHYSTPYQPNEREQKALDYIKANAPTRKCDIARACNITPSQCHSMLLRLFYLGYITFRGVMGSKIGIMLDYSRGRY
jgi:DNA-binding IclR family transcriptional regulator